MGDYQDSVPAYYYAIPSESCVEKQLSTNSLNEQDGIFYRTIPDITDQEPFMSASSDNNESSSSAAQPQKNSKQPPKARSIIPDYLLKQVQEKHEKEGAPPEVLERDRHNREKSEKMRDQRKERYSNSADDLSEDC